MTIKYILASCLASLMLVGAPLALAREGGVGADADTNAKVNMGLHLGSFFRADADARADARAEFKEERKAEMRERFETWRERWQDKFSHITAGIVTSIDGVLFTIDPFGAKATTTVTTNSDTVFKVKGEATSSSALEVGSKVIVVGTTTASSDSGDSFTASIVKILGEGWGHLRLFMGFHNK